MDLNSARSGNSCIVLVSLTSEEMSSSDASFSLQFNLELDKQWKMRLSKKIGSVLRIATRKTGSKNLKAE